MSRYSRDCEGFKIILSDKWMDRIKELLTEEEQEQTRQYYRWSSSCSDGKTKFEISELADASLAKIQAFLDFLADEGDRSARMSANLVRQWVEIKTSPDGAIVTKLENVPSAVKAYLEKSAPHRWIFEASDDGNTVPWLVTGSTYHPPTENSPANVTISLSALFGIHGGDSSRNSDSLRSSTSIQIYAEAFKKKTVGDVLFSKGFFVETSERIASYEKELQCFDACSDKDGYQLNVFGKAYLIGGWCSSGYRSVEKAGRPAKMVVDPPEYTKSVRVSHCPFWEKEEEVVWELPVQPILSMFDLASHERYRVHVNNTAPYIYDKTVGDKLILPKGIKDFVEVLVEHSRNAFVDIVSGKEGGTIILFEGPPGTGKTLSAEVYSEIMERPLYKVQSSQLGTDPKTVEAQLGEVLERAERWGAILLIDEADVYVHERGTDLKQNAIVGVFLRVLEYYRGVLFMTTNRGTLIDDAIISRLTALFKYTDPDEGAREQLWSVLAKQNDIQISDFDIKSLAKALPTTSGRDIKNLLKMAYVMALKKSQKTVTEDLVMFVSQFQAKVY